MSDPTDADAGRGTTPPELGREGQNIAGRPGEEAPVGFKPPENRADERQKVDLDTQERSGGSFDQAGTPPRPKSRPNRGGPPPVRSPMPTEKGPFRSDKDTQDQRDERAKAPVVNPSSDDKDLTELDKTVADSFPASDPPAH